MRLRAMPLCGFADRLKQQRRNGDQSENEVCEARTHGTVRMTVTASRVLIQIKPGS